MSFVTYTWSVMIIPTIERVKDFINQFFKSIVIATIAITSLFAIFSPVPVYAQNGGGVGFTECQFSAGSDNAGDASIQACLGQIFQFTFVVGMFIIAIRVALLAIGNYNPFDNGKAVNQTIGLVWEVTLGFILLGSPVLLINIINPAALNLSFLQIGNVVSQQGSSTPPGGGGSPDGGSSDSTSNSTDSTADPVVNNDGTTSSPEQLEAAVDDVQGGPIVDSSLSKIANSAFNGINANAQNIAPSNESVKIINNFLQIEQQCQKPFGSLRDFNNCRAIEQPEYITIRNSIQDRTRELYTPLFEASKSYSGLTYSLRSYAVLNTNIESSSTTRPGCNVYFAQIQEFQSEQTFIVSTELCSGDSISSSFWTVNGDVLVSTPNPEIPSGTQILTTGSFNVLN